MWKYSIFFALLTISRSIELDKLSDSENDSGEENERIPLEMSFDQFLQREADKEQFRRVRQVALAPMAQLGVAPAVSLAGMAPMVGMPMGGGMTAQEIASLPAILNQLKVMTESVLRTQQQQYQANAFANTWSNSWSAPMSPMGVGVGVPGGYMAQSYPQAGVYPGARPEPHPEPIAVGYNPYARTSMNLNFNLNYNSGCGRGGGSRYPVAGAAGYPMSGYAQPQSCPEPEPEPEPEPVAAPVMPVVAPALPVNSYNRAAMPMLPQPPMGPMFAADVKQAATPFVPHLNATEVTTTTPFPDIIEATNSPSEPSQPSELTQQSNTNPTPSESSE